MRKIMIALLVLGCAGAAQAAEPKAAPAAAKAAPSGNLKIGVVDPMVAMSGTDQAKKAFADLEKDTADQKAKLMKLESDLKGCNQKMQNEGATMSATEQVRLKTECEGKYRDYQGLGQSFTKQVTERQQAVLQDIWPKFQKAVNALAKEGDYDLVIQKEALSFAKPAFDVSAQVTTRINALK